MEYLHKNIDDECLDYNNASGRSVKEIINSKFDPENYFKLKGYNNGD
jgi:hypothetical protein